MSYPQKFIFAGHDKIWNAWMINYDLKLLRRESEHLLKKSKQRELSEWETERFSVLGHEISMLSLAAANCELEELLAA